MKPSFTRIEALILLLIVTVVFAFGIALQPIAPTAIALDTEVLLPSLIGIGLGYLMRSPTGEGSNAVHFRDGSKANVDSNGFINVAANFVSDLLNAGFSMFWAGEKRLVLGNVDANYQVLGSEVQGAENVTAQSSSTALTAGRNLTLPTVADMLAALPAGALPLNHSWKLRVINQQAGAFAFTMVTNTGWTLTGTMTIAQNTWRDFVVTITGTATATLVAAGTGTTS